MAEPFKNMYNKQFFDLFTKDLRLVIDDFDAHGFVSQIMDDEWEGRELKQRWIHITSILKKFLPADYKEAIAKILELLDHVKSTRPDFSVIDDTKFGLMLEYGVILNNYVEQYGLDDYETSVKAIEKITQFTSCEFVTHPFIIKYPDEMMKQMLVWSKHEHWGVRRLASEGCRPRFPVYGLSPLLTVPQVPSLQWVLLSLPVFRTVYFLQKVPLTPFPDDGQSRHSSYILPVLYQAVPIPAVPKMHNLFSGETKYLTPHLSLHSFGKHYPADGWLQVSQHDWQYTDGQPGSAYPVCRWK